MKVLLVEDEPELAESIQAYLGANDLRCEIVTNVEMALDRIAMHDYDCVLLDLGLPDGSGFEVLASLKHLRKSEGIIIISAKETLETRIEGLQAGADDYLTKPFHVSELLVRIQALVRRKQFAGLNTINFHEIEIDLRTKGAKVLGKAIDLTRKEYDLLLFLVGNDKKVLSKAAIAEHLSGDFADMLDNHDFVYTHIKNLKRKLAEAGCGDYIKTIYGLGYKWQND